MDRSEAGRRLGSSYPTLRGLNVGGHYDTSELDKRTFERELARNSRQ